MTITLPFKGDVSRWSSWREEVGSEGMEAHAAISDARIDMTIILSTLKRSFPWLQAISLQQYNNLINNQITPTTSFDFALTVHRTFDHTTKKDPRKLKSDILS
jgi:hypothetical protein